MSSLYLRRLSTQEYTELTKRLYEIQKGVCFICGESIDLDVHKGTLDIDHIVPLNVGGKDSPENFALTHRSCNRSKQDSDLQVARILHQFTKLRDDLISVNRGPNLNDVLQNHGGARFPLRFVRSGSFLKYSLSEINDNKVYEAKIYRDKLSQFEYAFVVLPIEYLHHDDKINPRSIGRNISKLVKEFYLKRPQLHVSLAWVDITQNSDYKVRIFDGQHKAAAQILLGVRVLPIRLFINPNRDILLLANTNAGTKLRQVAFDKSVQRHLGSTLYQERIQRFQRETQREPDNFDFSERDLLNFYKGESREIKRYILDNVRDGITHDPNNLLRDYIDLGGRKTERPLSYSSIEKTFYSFFIYQGVLDTPLNYKMDLGENPRVLEKEQIVHLMNIIADEIYVGKFDPDIGTRRIEYKIQNGEQFPPLHVRAFRMSKEEILYNWLKYIGQIIKSYFILQGKPFSEDKLFQYKFPEQIWSNIRLFIEALASLPIWQNNDLSATVFGSKQNYEFWQTIFETGKSPHGQQVLVDPLNWMDMIETG